MTNDCRRGSEIERLKEVTDLQEGMDFRNIELRREVFLRFYQFHTKYASHPGGVYYLLPDMIQELDGNEAHWLAYINGCCQHPMTTHVLFKKFQRGGIPKMCQWFNQNYALLGWDTDRRYHKAKFIECVNNFEALTEGKPDEYFTGLIKDSNPEQAFRAVWDEVMAQFKYFGRLATFSYLEYLNIIGLPILCDELFLWDKDGSRSHRNGLCKVLGRDDLDWHGSNPRFEGYSGEVTQWLTFEGETLLKEARERMHDQPYIDQVNYFTLESALCTFKSWFRPNRRYPNCYNDMMYERIKASEKNLPDEDFSPFWEARQENLPEELLLENNPWDCGLSPEKQNWFRETGQVIHLDLDWKCFKNGFYDKMNGVSGQ